MMNGKKLALTLGIATATLIAGGCSQTTYNTSSENTDTATRNLHVAESFDVDNASRIRGLEFVDQHTLRAQYAEGVDSDVGSDNDPFISTLQSADEHRVADIDFDGGRPASSTPHTSVDVVGGENNIIKNSGFRSRANANPDMLRGWGLTHLLDGTDGGVGKTDLFTEVAGSVLTTRGHTDDEPVFYPGAGVGLCAVPRTPDDDVPYNATASVAQSSGGPQLNFINPEHPRPLDKQATVSVFQSVAHDSGTEVVDVDTFDKNADNIPTKKLEGEPNRTGRFDVTYTGLSELECLNADSSKQMGLSHKNHILAVVDPQLARYSIADYADNKDDLPDMDIAVPRNQVLAIDPDTGHVDAVWTPDDAVGEVTSIAVDDSNRLWASVADRDDIVRLEM